MSKSNPRDRFDRYIGQRCAVPKCYKPRSGVSQWCNAHRQANAKWGHPTGRHITEKELRPYYREAGRVLKKYKDDPATEKALSIMYEILAPTAEPKLIGNAYKLTSPTWLLWRELVRLYEAQDVDGKPRPLHESEALRAALSVILFACRHKKRFPTNVALEYAMAHAVLTLRPLHSYRKPATRPRGRGKPGDIITISRKPPGLAKKRLGMLLQRYLWRYFTGCVAWLEAEYARKASGTQALAAWLDARMEEKKEAEKDYLRRGQEALLLEQSKVLETIQVNGRAALGEAEG